MQPFPQQGTKRGSRGARGARRTSRLNCLSERKQQESRALPTSPNRSSKRRSRLPARGTALQPVGVGSARAAGACRSSRSSLPLGMVARRPAPAPRGGPAGQRGARTPRTRRPLGGAGAGAGPRLGRRPPRRPSRPAPWLLGPAELPLPAPRPSPLAVAPPGGWPERGAVPPACGVRSGGRGRGRLRRAAARTAARGARRHGSACSGER